MKIEEKDLIKLLERAFNIGVFEGEDRRSRREFGLKTPPLKSTRNRVIKDILKDITNDTP